MRRAVFFSFCRVELFFLDQKMAESSVTPTPTKKRRVALITGITGQVKSIFSNKPLTMFFLFQGRKLFDRVSS